MPLAVYRKADFSSLSQPKRNSAWVPTLMISGGSMLIGAVFGPILGYFIFISPKLEKSTLISPLPTSAGTAILGASLADPAVFSQIDYRKPENWFPKAVFQKPADNQIANYTLSIPKLRIENMIVTIGGTDLSKSMIQYPGTASPGELGSPVIFGHSILRQFYNPKNYISIFSTIMTLDYGDVININFDGVDYKYKVIDKIEVKPEDIQILEQKYNGRYLKLVTCVPEGTYLRRGVVIAELTKS